MNDDDMARLETRLRNLPEREAIVFMAALTERLLHNYRLFHEVSGGGDRRRVDSAMALVWEALLVPAARIDFTLQGEKLAAIEAGLDDQLAESDVSFGAQMARDATLALSTCLEALAGQRPEGALELSRLSRHGVERFIELSEGEEIEDEEGLSALIDAHPLMADERDFQQEVLERLEAPLDAPALRALKRLGRNEGVSNIGLSLDDE
ncbi:YjaG family protein [Halotalea alkalilenta]|nr:DUF416 family protein [Halotalea alkalilenta]